MILLFPILTFAKDIRVMVLDTGIDSTHKYLQPYLDKEDVQQYPQNYIDKRGHGTHVAGIIASTRVKNLKIISCKFYDVNDGSFKDLYGCLERAILEDFDFVNFSGGGNTFDPKEYELIKTLTENGTIMVVSAGNDNHNLGSPCWGYFPACYLLPNLYPVGSLGRNGQRYPSSNYGNNDIVWITGEDIMSTLPNNRYGRMTGTSMAAALYTHVLVKKKFILEQ